jgi:hypothetical protein
MTAINYKMLRKISTFYLFFVVIQWYLFGLNTIIKQDLIIHWNYYLEHTIFRLLFLCVLLNLTFLTIKNIVNSKILIKLCKDLMLGEPINMFRLNLTFFKYKKSSNHITIHFMIIFLLTLIELIFF